MKALEAALVMYQVVLKTAVLWAPIVIVCMLFATLEYIHQTEKRK